MELTFAMTSGTVTRDKEKNWPVADGRVPCNNPRNICGMHLARGRDSTNERGGDARQKL